MAEYRYYLIPDFMSHVFPQQFEEQAPTEFFSNTADLMKRYQQLREMPYNNEYTWNERTNLPYPRLTVGIDRRDPDGAVTIMQVRNGVNFPFNLPIFYIQHTICKIVKVVKAVFCDQNCFALLFPEAQDLPQVINSSHIQIRRWFVQDHNSRQQYT